MIQSMEEYLENLFLKENITLTKRQLCQFIEYYNLLIEWNAKINLTAITGFEDVCLKHFVDSSGIVKFFSSYDKAFEALSSKNLVDVGSGAGFPGICLSILFPKLKITLIDSLDKRIRFLNEVISKLSLNNIVAVHGRVEDLAQTSEYRECFDIATARAVASLPVLSEYCLPFVRIGGLFIAYKSEKAEEEIGLSKNALSVLGGKLTDLVNFSFADTDICRTMIKITKEKATPSKYPRKAGTPSKNPL